MTVPPAPTGAPAKRRGRKPRASRDEIVRAAVELLEQEPAEPLTMARVAEAVGLAPMTLYRYFEDRDALMNAIARAVVEARPPIDVADEAPWQDHVRAWMVSIRDNLVRYPQLLHLAASGTYQGWLVDGAELLAILERAGRWDDDQLVRAHYWVSATTLGHAMIEATRPPRPPTAELYAELGRLPDDSAAEMARLIPALARLHDDAFSLAVDCTIAALEPMAPRGRKR
jgi:TetR/AcrR family tetracycline transcriptional repressor